MHVAILANDIVPGMGLPVAAPGLRAWGLALGLRRHGHEVTVIVEEWLVRQVWGEDVPPPLPPDTTILRAKQVAKFCRTQRVGALVITNSNHITALGPLGRTRLVYDFFAPKMLELAENLERADLQVAKEELERRKLLALSRSDLVIVNGVKKLDYVRGWLERSGVPDLPLAVVNPGIPPLSPAPRDDGKLRVMVSGYLQPWSKPGAWLDAVIPLLDEGLIELHLIVGMHWGQRSTTEVMPEGMRRLAEHPSVVSHPLLRLGDFRILQASCHVAIDVFSRNPERELAMVTRSVVALSCGLPIMHVGFTEVSPWITEYDAGWLVDEEDSAEMERVLREVALDRGLLEPKRAGAVAIAQGVLAPKLAAAPLADLLRSAR